MNKPFDKQELAALAMHELMIREQEKMRQRIAEQNKLKYKTDDALREIVRTGVARTERE